jgi:putative membrane protein
MIRFTRYAAAMVACFTMVLAAQAQQQQAPAAQQAGAQQSSGGMAALDKLFLKEAACGNMFEVQLGQLAQQKAQDAKVKQFAQEMVRDHTKALEELKQVAQKKGAQIPTDLPDEKQEALQAFGQLQGSEFDQAYLSCMKVDHISDVAAFQEKSKNAKDPEIKSFAAKTLPTLQHHKQQVLAMTGGASMDEAKTAGSRQQSDDDRKDQAGSSSASDRSTNSSGTGSRENGSGTTSGGGTTGAGSHSGSGSSDR